MATPQPAHLPEILAVHGQHQWMTRCGECGLLSMDVARGLSEDIARDHYAEHHPDLAAPIEPPNPEHGQADSVRLAHGWRLKTRCHCGRTWTGSDDAAHAALAQHLHRVGFAPSAPVPTPDVQGQVARIR